MEMKPTNTASQMLFYLKQISQEEYKPSEEKQTERIINFLQNEIEINKKDCIPNLYVINYNSDFLREGDTFQIEIWGSFYEVTIEEEILVSNPDPNDPKVKPPSNGAANNESPILDPFIPIKDKYLQAAANNKFASQTENQRNSNNYYPVVAVLDTGIDLRYFKIDDDCLIAPLHYFESLCPLPRKACGCYAYESNIYGYSFYQHGPYLVEPQNPFDNDGYHKHGTRISKLIANICNNKVRIMPLKTANYAGFHRLSDIYKALLYVLEYNAKQQNDRDKVKVVNCSWSYSFSSEPVIMKSILNQLSDSGVAIVTSAGNEGEIIGNSNRRYPAMFSRPDNHIYTVTTVCKQNGSITVVENRSQQFVDIGVMARRDGRFKDPLDNGYQAQGIEGSSYAAAIYSGYLANQIAQGSHLDILDEINSDESSASLARDRGNKGNIVILDSVV